MAEIEIEPKRRVNVLPWIVGVVLLVLVILHLRQSPDDRLPGSLLDTCTHVLGIVSLATMLALAIDALAGDTHPVGLALRMRAAGPGARTARRAGRGPGLPPGLATPPPPRRAGPGRQPDWGGMMDRPRRVPVP